LLIFRYWESGNDVVIRVGESKESGDITVVGSFTSSKESWEEFKLSFCKCNEENKHLQPIRFHPGL
jgi:hypothetical protein